MHIIKVEYLVKWLGCGAKDNSWELRRSLFPSIDEFERKRELAAAVSSK